MHCGLAVSAKFIEALQHHPERAYRLWRRGGVDPTTGSKLIHGATLVRPNDERIIVVGRLLGLEASQCFEVEAPPEEEQAEAAPTTT